MSVTNIALHKHHSRVNFTAGLNAWPPPRSSCISSSILTARLGILRTWREIVKEILDAPQR